MAEWKALSDEELDAQIEASRLDSRLASEQEPRAVAARYERDVRRVVLDLNNGAIFIFPVDKVQGLQGASHEDLAEIEISPSGEGLHWPRLDWDCGVPSLTAGRFGSAAWMERERNKQEGKPPQAAQG